ncbi:MAG: NAD(P)/FAD-dependent oxidoreductase [Deltaproteobacteria bacterium]|nr:NAD(P)/FAD-dependent oxidoreductase [Deltaproteobacteria bacterium]
MKSFNVHDAIVVGSGPNGLSAAIHLARSGLSVKVIEAKQTIGGATRSKELTLPGFIHDVFSAVHPLALTSPFFSQLNLETYGVNWINPPAAVAHPFDDGSVVLLDRSVNKTARQLSADGPAYTRLISPLKDSWSQLSRFLLGHHTIPANPRLMACFGLRAVRSANSLAQNLFTGSRAKGFIAGLAAHSILPLTKPISAAFALVMAVSAHAVGWPLAAGGSQNIAAALANCLTSHGGVITTDSPLESINTLPKTRAVLFDVTPRQLLHFDALPLPGHYRNQLSRYSFGPGVCKMDWALDGPIPWKAPQCSQAATVHIGGSLDEIARSEAQVWKGIHPEKPFVLLCQPSLFDTSRAPEGKHTAWAYCHVPHGSPVDMGEQITKQIERFAPGFRDLVLARHVIKANEFADYNPNLIGGDISGGAQTFLQFFFRPAFRFDPYAIPVKGMYLCSSSTPPGAGVHGMCGYHAARSALRNTFKK